MPEKTVSLGALNLLRSLSKNPITREWPVTKIKATGVAPDGKMIVFYENNVKKPVSLDSQKEPTDCTFCTDHTLPSATMAYFHGWAISPNKYPKVPGELVLRSDKHTSEITPEDFFTWMRFSEGSGMTISYSPARKSIPEHKHANAFPFRTEAPLFRTQLREVANNISVTSDFEYPSIVIQGSIWNRYSNMMTILNNLHDRQLQYVIALTPDKVYICPSNTPHAIVANREYIGYKTVSSAQEFELLKTQSIVQNATNHVKYLSAEELTDLVTESLRLQMSVGEVNSQNEFANGTPIWTIGRRATYSSRSWPSHATAESTAIFQTTKDHHYIVSGESDRPLVPVDSAVLTAKDVETIDEPTTEIQDQVTVDYRVKLDVANLKSYLEGQSFIPKILCIVGKIDPVVQKYMLTQFPQTTLMSIPDPTRLMFDKLLVKRFADTIHTKLFSDEGSPHDVDTPIKYHEVDSMRINTSDEPAIIAVFSHEEFQENPGVVDGLLTEIGMLTQSQIFPIQIHYSQAPLYKPDTNLVEDVSAVLKNASTAEVDAYKVLTSVRSQLQNFRVPVIIPEVRGFIADEATSLQLQKLPDFNQLPIHLSYGEEIEIPVTHLAAMSDAFDHFRATIPTKDLAHFDDYDFVMDTTPPMCVEYLDQLRTPDNAEIINHAKSIISFTQSLTERLPRFAAHRDPNINNVRVVETDDGKLSVQMIDFERFGPSPKGYDEAKVLTHFMLSEELMNDWYSLVKEKFTPEELIYFWRTVTVRSAIEYSYLDRGDFDERISAAGLSLKEFKSRFKRAAIALISRADNEVRTIMRDYSI